jgi:hypothetical protein
MKNLILIIMFLLLCPALVLAEGEGSIDDISVAKDYGNQDASILIANDIFLNEFIKEYGYTSRLWALLRKTGYPNLAEEVLKKVILDKHVGPYSNWFYKHNKKHKYNADDDDMLEMVLITLQVERVGYQMGLAQSLSMVFQMYENVAVELKDSALQLYEIYLEDTK